MMQVRKAGLDGVDHTAAALTLRKKWNTTIEREGHHHPLIKYKDHGRKHITVQAWNCHWTTTTTTTNYRLQLQLLPTITLLQ